MAAERRFHAEPQRPEQPACSDGRRGHGDAEWGGQEATQSSLHLPQLQRVWRKVGFRENLKKEHITNTKIPGGGGVKLTFVKVKKKELTQKN